MNAGRKAAQQARRRAAEARTHVAALQRASAAGTPEAQASTGFTVGERSAPSYRGTADRRILRTWSAPPIAANAAIAAENPGLRNRAREQERNNAWVASGIDSAAANIIGTGIRPSWQLDDEALKKRIHELWNDWVPEADAEGMLDFYGLQRLLGRAVIRDGEALVRLRLRRASDDLAVPLQLQLLESDHLPLEKNEILPSGREVRHGIEFDGRGRRRAYHLLREHPGEESALFPLTRSGAGREYVVVPAARVVHVFSPTRIGQIRGASKLAPGLVRMYLLGRYDEYELVRQYVSSNITGIVRGGAVLGADEEAEEVTLEPGAFARLDNAEEIDFPDLPEPSAYDRFVPTQLRAMAVAMGTTYEAVTGDLTRVNYSSIRAGMLEAERRGQCFQRDLVHQFARRVAAAWLEQAVLSGALSLPEFAADRRRYHRIEWLPQAMAWVDPDNEARAEAAKIQARIESRDTVIRRRTGRDPAELDAEIAASEKRLQALLPQPQGEQGAPEGGGQSSEERDRQEREEREQREGEGPAPRRQPPRRSAR